MYYDETAKNYFAIGKKHLKGMEMRDEGSVLIHMKKWHQSDFATLPCRQFRMSVTSDTRESERETGSSTTYIS